MVKLLINLLRILLRPGRTQIFCIPYERFKLLDHRGLSIRCAVLKDYNIVIYASTYIVYKCNSRLNYLKQWRSSFDRNRHFSNIDSREMCVWWFGQAAVVRNHLTRSVNWSSNLCRATISRGVCKHNESVARGLVKQMRGRRYRWGIYMKP